jgi:hypothetical protein
MFGFVTKILGRKGRAIRPAPVRPRRRAHLHLEELMPRVLPNASPLSVVSGHLLIHGSRGNDLVTVSVDSHNHGKLDVNVNHHAYQVNAKGVHQIVFTENGVHDRLINKTHIMAQLDSGSGQSGQDNEGTSARLEATLSNASGATGKAQFNGDGELDVSVKGAAASTTLNVLVDGTQVGTLTTDAHGNGELELSQSGLVKTGSTITVGDLTGTFAAPTSTGGDNDGDNGGDNGGGDHGGQGAGTSLQAALTNASGATGKAEFNSGDGDLEVRVQGAAASTTLNVLIDGNQVGTITTDASGNGKLQLPKSGLTVNSGSTIAVGDLTGSFAAPTNTGGDNDDDNGDDHHGGEGSGTSLQAALTNASGATGKAEFSSADGDLEVRVQGAAASTTLNVLIDGNQVGTITTDANGDGKMELSQSGLTVNSGSTIAVGDLTGTFAAPAPEVHLFAQLTGATGVSGKAEFSSEHDELQVEISGAAANTAYNITIDTVVVGTVTTDASGQAEFHSSNGSTVTVKAGSAISVADTAGNPAILQGTFATSSQCHGGD